MSNLNQVKTSNMNKKYIFCFQEENVCIVTNEFLEKHPECILNDFIQIDGEEEDDEIYIDYTVHYPELLISIIEGESSDTPLDDTIDVSLLKNDFLTLFPDRDGRTSVAVNTLSKPIFDYCSKSKDSICHCKTPVYSCAPTSDSDTYQNKIVDTMNFQDKYVYIVSGQLSDSKINELKQLSRYFSFFNFITISIESTFTLDLDITTVINNQYLTIFPNLPSLHIRCILYVLYDEYFVDWILDNPYKDTIEEIYYSNTDSLTNYLSIFRDNFYPSIKNIHFSYNSLQTYSLSTIPKQLSTLYSTTVETLSFDYININENLREQIPMIISGITKTCFPNMKKISFYKVLCLKVEIFKNCTKNSEIFEEINLKGMNSYGICDFINAYINGVFPNLQYINIDYLPINVPLPVLSFYQTIFNKRIINTIDKLIIDYNDRIRWNSLSFFSKISSTIQKLSINSNINSNTINDMIELFTPLVFTKLRQFQLNVEPISFLPSLLLLLSSPSPFHPFRHL
ncbi:hypothetical protein WA158_007646 [Blastocystis sp. Blastoise]